MKTANKYLLLIIILLSSIDSYSQNSDEKEVYISHMSIDIDVVGAIAFTTYDIEIYNPNRRQFEYELILPLSPDENVVDYKLSIGEELRSGVVVDKDKARQAFEEIVNRRVDPGVIEKITGNNYRLRVYPVMPRNYRHTVIVTQQVLPLVNGQYTYSLAPNSQKKLPKFDLQIHTHDISAQPTFDNNTLTNFDFESSQNPHDASFSAKNYTNDKPIIFSLPQSKKPDTFTQTDRYGVKWFYAPFSLTPSQTLKSEPCQKLTVIWDNSMSGLNRDLKKELNLLRRFISESKPKYIDLITFGDELSTTKTFTDTTKLYTHLNSIRYDGRSDLSLLNNIKCSWDKAILFSDGVSSLGEITTPLSLPLVAVVSSSSNDAAALKRLNAEIIDLNITDLESAISIINGRANKVTNITSITGSFKSLSLKIGDLASDVNALYGALNGDKAEAKIDFSSGESVIIKIDDSSKSINNLDNSLNYTMLARLWAADEINSILIEEGEKGKSKIVDLATQYGVVTKYTSLMVLEEISDYLRYDITPPEELLTEKYYELLGNKKARDNAMDLTYSNFTKINYDIAKYYKPIMYWWLDDEQKQKELAIKLNNKLLIDLESENIKTDSSTLYSTPTMTISGNVRSLSYQALPGAIVMINKSSTGTVTDTDGYFTLNVPIGSDIRVIYLGYKTVHLIATEGKDILDIAMTEEMLNVEEVIVVSYGTERRSQSTDYSESQYEETEIIEDQEVVSDQDSAVDNELDTQTRNTRTVANTKTIKLKAWNPNDRYFKILKKYDDVEELYNKYMEIRTDYELLPQFYIDVADLLFEKGDCKRALKVLGNLVEIANEDSEIVTNYAHKLMTYNNFLIAVKAFKVGVTLRPEHPQQLRALALALEANGDFQQSLDTFYSIMAQKWRLFDNIKPIIFTEINSLIAKHKQSLDLSQIDDRIIFEMPVNARVVISWGTDNCDIDLHVKEPTLEYCSFKNRQTSIGGRISYDFTSGFGPEEYMIKKAKKGGYDIKVDYYGSRVQKLIIPTYVYADIFTDYGTPNQKHERITIRLDDFQDDYEIGKIKIER